MKKAIKEKSSLLVLFTLTAIGVIILLILIMEIKKATQIKYLQVVCSLKKHIILQTLKKKKKSKF